MDDNKFKNEKQQKKINDMKSLVEASNEMSFTYIIKIQIFDFVVEEIW